MVLRKGTEHGNVDALSSILFPSSSVDDQKRPSDIVLIFDDKLEPPRWAEDHCEATSRDSELATVIPDLQSGS